MNGDPVKFHVPAALALAALEKLDAAVIVVDEHLRVLLANSSATRQLGTKTALYIADGMLRLGEVGSDSARLRTAVADAIDRDLQSLVVVRQNGRKQLPLAVIPSNTPFRSAIVMPGRSELCQELSLRSYARELGLTSSEIDVLQELSSGLSPENIAARRCVKLSTIRTQITSIRGKIGALDLRDLVHTLGRLPPLPGRRLTRALVWHAVDS